MKFRKIPIFILFVFFVISMNAQLFDTSKDFNLFRKYKPWGIQFSANLYPFYTHTTPSVAELTPLRYMMWGGSAGLVYHLRFTNHFGLKFNLKAEMQPVYSYKFHLNDAQTSDGNDFNDNTGNQYGSFQFRLPVGMEFRSYYMRRYIFFMQAGMDFGYMLGYNKIKSHNTYFQTAFIGKNFFTYDPYVKFGWYYEFPRLLWQTAIVYRHTLKNYYKGGYTVNHMKTAPSETGFISQSGKYIGLEFVLYFKRPDTGEADCPGKVHSKKVLKRQRAIQKARRRAEKAEDKIRRKEIKRNRRLKRKNKKNKKRKKFIIF